jgi:hypothetical protein
MADIEGALIAGRAPRYVQIATAAVPDGPETVAKWHRLGAEQAERLGVTQVVIDVQERHDAEDPALVSLVEGAGLIYLSGGHPDYFGRHAARKRPCGPRSTASGSPGPLWLVAAPAPWR